MEEILKSLKNPFDIEGFTNLINMLTSSDTARDFYSKIVAVYQDRSMEEIEERSIHLPESFVYTSHMGHWSLNQYYSNHFLTKHRIYINSSLEASATLSELFMTECIKANLPFDLKYANKRNTRSDGIVIGSSTEAYKKHIDILRRIANDHPELIKQCGTPHLLTASLDGWMGLADENVPNTRLSHALSYSESRVGVIIASCIKFLVNHPEIEGEIEGYRKAISYYNQTKENSTANIESRISRGKVDETQKDSLITSEWNNEISNLYNEFSYRFSYRDFGKALARLSSKNPNIINELYEYFLDTCKHVGINPNMPTQYANSQKDLLQVQENEPTLDPKELEDKRLPSIINEYLGDSAKQMTMEDRIVLLDMIDKKASEETQRLFDIIDDYTSLTGNKANKVESSIREMHEMFDRFRYRWKGNRDYRESPLYEIDSERLEKIKKRGTEFLDGFLVPSEEYQKSSGTLGRLIEKNVKDNPNYHLMYSLNYDEISYYLQFIADNYDEIKSDFSEISSKIQSLTVDTVRLNRRPTFTEFEEEVGDERIAKGLQGGERQISNLRSVSSRYLYR